MVSVTDHPNASFAARVPRRDWDRAPWNRWAFQHVRELLPTVGIRRGPGPASPLPRAEQDLDPLSFELDGRRVTIGAFLDGSFTDGFIVLHRGAVVTERYMNGMAPHTAHLSQSVAKSVVGTMAGILIGRGVLDPEAPLTDYLPELAATAYRGATLQHVLDMTSGVAFDEDYTSPNSDMARLDVASGWKPSPDPAWPATVWQLILGLKTQEREHGTAFHYRSIETDVLAFAMERATGTPLADLVGRELWAPLGAEEDAYFTVDPAGYALADGGFNATLRDYARFGLLHANQGRIGGRQILSHDWIRRMRTGDTPTLSADYRALLPDGAYRNQFWIEDATRRAYMARGVFGQCIYIDPEAELVVVKLSSWPEFLSVARSRELLAAIDAIRRALQGRS